MWLQVHISGTGKNQVLLKGQAADLLALYGCVRRSPCHFDGRPLSDVECVALLQALKNMEGGYRDGTKFKEIKITQHPAVNLHVKSG